MFWHLYSATQNCVYAIRTLANAAYVEIFDPAEEKLINPWALHRIAETLLEADQRGLWRAKPETKAELQKLYLEIEGELEGRSDD